ncbi:serine/threonine-protein kinase [Microbacterium betulae]|uniref:non-specific serine/threonine protein kinase n=1 Tax=Microbacterium betulae TaxID=2981139 RepID=A0AA97FGP5_9MICO|nr:serine/threonine-protein kinase [Microbacterium sp. AB]WOF22660.1 serine/threonine-protein kinase [Microbacterium sp. AB]
MSPSRPAAPPPRIPGFRHVDLLGSGGFADVYRYEQELPRRQVAIKVLPADREGASTARFTAEANVMAMLSTHPAIVTILQAGVSDDGRPYLVMEYCPGSNLQARCRREPFSVAEALRVGIPIASAVETAHRAGVLHRDIKPANILVTEYRRPALTDFGIAATSLGSPETTCVSIPWSPPESFGDVARSGPRSDVYQLGATLYTLLAGRSPFELAGGGNTTGELIERIERMELPRIDRPDVPPSLQAVLATATAKDPADRHRSALAFARALQKVQIELAHAVTPIDIVEDVSSVEPAEDEEAGLTRVRVVAGAAPAGTDAEPARPARRAPAPRVAERVWRGRGGVRGRRSRAVAGGVVAAVVLGVVGSLLPALVDRSSARALDASTVSARTAVPAVPGVEDLAGWRQGDEAVFTWTNPEPLDGDSYLWAVASVGSEPGFDRTAEPTVTVPAVEGETCVEVILRRDDGWSSEAVVGCVDG